MHGELDQMLHDFLIESQENLERLERELMELEQDPDNDELIRSVFRIIHSIKGNARFLNLTSLDRLAHRAEDVLTKLRDHSLLLNTELSTVLLRSVDVIKSMLPYLKHRFSRVVHVFVNSPPPNFCPHQNIYQVFPCRIYRGI
ncbi:MAG: hypothetical protein GY801_12420 [bacterium]|nr:hypothetical protein [bacterium]